MTTPTTPWPSGELPPPPVGATRRPRDGAALPLRLVGIGVVLVIDLATGVYLGERPLSAEPQRSIEIGGQTIPYSTFTTLPPVQMTPVQAVDAPHGVDYTATGRRFRVTVDPSWQSTDHNIGGGRVEHVWFPDPKNNNFFFTISTTPISADTTLESEVRYWPSASLVTCADGRKIAFIDGRTTYTTPDDGTMTLESRTWLTIVGDRLVQARVSANVNNIALARTGIEPYAESIRRA